MALNVSRDEVFATVLSEYEAQMSADVTLSRCRQEVQHKGVLLPEEVVNDMTVLLRSYEFPKDRERRKVHADDYLVLEQPPPGAPLESQGAKRAKIKRER